MKTLINTVRLSTSHYISPHNANYRAIIAQYLGMGSNNVPYLYLIQWRHITCNMNGCRTKECLYMDG